MTDRYCGGCRYWSEMVAKVIDGAVMALCIAPAGSPRKGNYTTQTSTCSAFAKASHGAVDSPPNYGETALAAYAADAERKHPNGAPVFAPDGTMLDERGNRSIFDDVDE